MKETEYSRRLDSSGRLVIPSKLRGELKMEQGDEYAFYIHEHEGRTYLCVECFRKEDEIERAKRILEQAGIKIQEN
jgi:bifunctional DNA-binding transcriptional regulator/antitoxin component of YhaV-PrlF toxin-antitoxin module